MNAPSPTGTVDLLLAMRERYALNAHFCAQVNAQLAALRPDVEQALARLDAILSSGGPLVSASVGAPETLRSGPDAGKWTVAVNVKRGPRDWNWLFPRFDTEADALAYRDGANASLDCAA